MNTEDASRVTRLFNSLTGIAKRLFEALNAPQRSDSPKTAGMFAGSLVSQDYETHHK